MAIGLAVGFVALRLGMGLATAGIGPDRILGWLGGGPSKTLGFAARAQQTIQSRRAA